MSLDLHMALIGPTWRIFDLLAILLLLEQLRDQLEYILHAMLSVPYQHSY